MTIPQDLQIAILANNPNKITLEILANADFTEALLLALEQKSDEASERLVSLISRSDLLKILHAENNVLFRTAATRENLDILSLFIESTLDSKQLQQMVSSNNDEAFKSKKSATFLAVILGDEIGRSEISGSLNEAKIAKFRELKKLVKQRMAAMNLAVEASDSHEFDEQMANLVVATCVNRDDLESEFHSAEFLNIFNQQDLTLFFDEITKILTKDATFSPTSETEELQNCHLVKF